MNQWNEEYYEIKEKDKLRKFCLNPKNKNKVIAFDEDGNWEQATLEHRDWDKEMMYGVYEIVSNDNLKVDPLFEYVECEIYGHLTAWQK